MSICKLGNRSPLGKFCGLFWWGVFACILQTQSLHCWCLLPVLKIYLILISRMWFADQWKIVYTGKQEDFRVWFWHAALAERLNHTGRRVLYSNTARWNSSFPPSGNYLAVGVSPRARGSPQGRRSHRGHLCEGRMGSFENGVATITFQQVGEPTAVACPDGRTEAGAVYCTVAGPLHYRTVALHWKSTISACTRQGRPNGFGWRASAADFLSQNDRYGHE